VSSSIFWIGTIVKSNSELACVETAAEAENFQQLFKEGEQFLKKVIRLERIITGASSS